MNLTRVTNSLVTRLIVFGVVLIIVGATARYILLSKILRDNLIEVFSAQQVSLADAAARDVDYKLDQRRRLLAQLARTLPQDLLGDPERLRDWLQQRQELMPLFSLGVVVADPNGKVLADFPPVPGRVGSSIAGDTDFAQVRDGQPVIEHPLIDPYSKQPALPMAAPIKDRAGHVRAILAGTTALAAPGFLDRVRNGRIGQTGGFLLVSPRDKLFISSSDPAMVFKPTPPAGVNPLHDQAMAGLRGSGVTLNAKGVEEISAMSPVPSTGWFVVARLPTAEALATVATLQRYVILSSIGGVVVVLLVVGGLVTWMLRPLYRAAALATRMTNGEISLEQLPVVYQDEVGHMTLAFNRLLAKLAASQAELERMAHQDALTGLPNRSLLAERMQQALARAQRNGTRVALLFLDLDGFKPLNDTLGHEAGDDALIGIARRLQTVVRATDTLARVGGDEFILLAPDLTEPAEDGAHILAAKCIAAVAQPLSWNNVDYALGVSIGIAVCAGSCSADRLLAMADKAMYRAKQDGRGCFVMAPTCDNCPRRLAVA